MPGRPGTSSGAGARGADGIRSATRPAAARRTGAFASAKRTRAPQPRRLTGRATTLGALLIALLLAYAYPMRVYLAQQAEIAALEREQAAQQERIGGLVERRQKWDDPEYITSQARKRLNYVPRGVVPLIVVDQGSDGSTMQNGPVDVPDGADIPWYSKLWSSVQAADQPQSR